MSDIQNFSKDEIPHNAGGHVHASIPHDIHGDGDNTKNSHFSSPLGLMGGDPVNPVDQMIPDDFIFRQNEIRNDDLEVEERALMNL